MSWRLYACGADAGLAGDDSCGSDTCAIDGSDGGGDVDLMAADLAGGLDIGSIDPGI